MRKLVGLVTPTHGPDIEHFALLCETVDRFVFGHAKHYVIVRDDEMARFATFNGPKRVVLPASQFLPRWLWPAPAFVSRKGRRIWLSLRSRPVQGWHIQQLLKIEAAATLPEERFCILDSDTAFFRPFDVGAYAGDEKAPLYLEPRAIKAGAPWHASWTNNASRLLGLPPVAFPADDFIGHQIVWDQATVRDMIRKIETTTNLDCRAALCRARAFSEYILYGRHVEASAELMATHAATPSGPAIAYWDFAPLDANAVRAMMDTASPEKAALCVASISNTSVSMIREVLKAAAPTSPRRPMPEVA
jgi:hypothetical protein